MSANTVQQLSDSVAQVGSSSRYQSSVVVSEATQSEDQSIKTRRVRNHNANHALTIQYFNVLKHYRVQTVLDHTTQVLFVPYDVPWFLVSPFPEKQADYNALTDKEGPKRAVQWIARHGPEISASLPRGAGRYMRAIYRLANDKEDEVPIVRKWTLEIDETW